MWIPAVSLPLFFRGWTFRPEVQLRNTIYSQQQSAVQSVSIAHHKLFNRRTIASSIELRPPALSKVFDGTIAGRKIKHTIEPRIVYRYTNGVEKFGSIIRFDFRDILSNTNEVEVRPAATAFYQAGAPRVQPGTTSDTSALTIAAAACLCAGGRG